MALRERADTERGQVYVQVLASVLDLLVSSNDGQESPPVTRFHALRAPNISVKDYLERILKYSACSAECFVLALVYIDRLIQQHNLVLSTLNVHRVIITSVMLAAKFFDDLYYNNAYYAKVGGVQCHELNALELEFLFSVNFSLHVTAEEFSKYHSELLRHLQGLNPSPVMVQAATTGCVSPQFGGPSTAVVVEQFGAAAAGGGGAAQQQAAHASDTDVVLQGRGQGGGRLLTDHAYAAAPVAGVAAGAPVYAAPAAYAGAQGYAGGHLK